MPAAVDYFAGAGGLTTGALWAGLPVVGAVNHWPTAVATHFLNHPSVKHYCQDAALLNPRRLPWSDVLLGAPECRGHTKAGGRNKADHNESRATAWCIVNTAEVIRQPLVLIENVYEFVDKWDLWPSWLDAMQRLGYRVTVNRLNAADFGTPQERHRLIIVCSLDGRARVIEPPAQVQHVPAWDVVDFSAGSWSTVKGHCQRTVDRVRVGRRRWGRRFLLSYYGTGENTRSLDRPIGTITTKDRWAVIDGGRMRMISIPEARKAMSFPASYQLAGDLGEQMKQLGNAVCPLMAQAAVQQALAA